MLESTEKLLKLLVLDSQKKNEFAYVSITLVPLHSVSSDSRISSMSLFSSTAKSNIAKLSFDDSTKLLWNKKISI